MATSFAKTAIGLAAATASICAMADTPYDTAVARAKADDARPEVKAWYGIAKMSEAINTFASTSLQQCVRSYGLQGAEGASFVTSIAAGGQVDAVFSNSATPFASCMKDQLAHRTFPAPPHPVYMTLMSASPASR